MSTAAKNASRLMKYVDIRVVLGDDMDEAVEAAIDKVYMMRSEEARADIFGFIREQFDLYPNGTTRKIALVNKLRAYEISRIYR